MFIVWAYFADMFSFFSSDNIFYFYTLKFPHNHRVIQIILQFQEFGNWLTRVCRNMEGQVVTLLGLSIFCR